MYKERVVVFRSAHLPSMHSHPFVFENHPSASRLFDDNVACIHIVDSVNSLALPNLTYVLVHTHYGHIYLRSLIMLWR